MQIQGKALYNLLRHNWLRNPAMTIEPWKVEDYRQIPLKELWKRLHEIGIDLDEKRFLVFAENCESPEELTECLWLKESDVEGEDRLYLIIFELWRRILSKKQTLSLFCDEFDHRIDRYLENPEEVDELLQESFVELEDVLDQNTDEGRDPKDTFLLVSHYCAHDLESFLYDYIAQQIDKNNDLYASELLDGFYEYVQEQKWFDFLRIRLFFMTDSAQGSVILRRLIEQVQEDPELDLLLEIADFLLVKEEPELFFQAMVQACKLIECEEDFHEVALILADYFQSHSRPEAKALRDIHEKRSSYSPEEQVSASDIDFLFVQNLLTKEYSLAGRKDASDLI